MATPGCGSSSPARCVNCVGEHIAIHKDCESRQELPPLRYSNPAAEAVAPPLAADAIDMATDNQDVSLPPTPTR